MRYLDSEKAENKIFCWICCPDHGAKISPNLANCMTPNQGRGPSFLSPISRFYRRKHISSKKIADLLGLYGVKNEFGGVKSGVLDPVNPQGPKIEDQGP